jgi:hypothetical protein
MAMNDTLSWLLLLMSAVVLGGYEVFLTLAASRNPQATARSAHAVLREEWVHSLSRQQGSEIVAVQALRNSLMSATISASTAALALMGMLTLVSSAAVQNVSLIAMQQITVQLALELLLLASLFASYVCSAMAMRYFSHATFILSLPVGSSERECRTPMAATYVKRAGMLYSWGLRLFLLLAPIAAGLINPLAMPFAAVALVFVLHVFDKGPGDPPN